MRRGFADDHVELEESDGRKLPALLRLDAELWNKRHTVLTVLMHPGRLKSGIGVAKDSSLPLRAGRRYRLVIKADWPSRYGSRLEDAAEKRFEAARPWLTQLDRHKVKVMAPGARSRDWLKLRFDRPLNWAQMRRAIAVVGNRDKPLPGRVNICNSEREWWFRPSVEWTSCDYRILVDGGLEDLCGNGFERPFEGPPAELAGERRLVLPFVPRGVNAAARDPA
jgi:hypothetical protein